MDKITQELEQNKIKIEILGKHMKDHILDNKD